MRARLRRDERGAAALEFALILPVFLLIIYGALSFGLAMSVQSSLNQAAAEGARAAVGATDSTYQSVAQAAAQARVTATVGAANGKYAVVTPSGPYVCGTGTCVRITISYPYSTHPVIPAAPGLGLILPATLNSAYEVQVS